MVTLSGRNRSQKSRSASSLNNYLTDFNQTCFYDIKHVLSAIAKFLVYIPGEEEGMASDGRVGKDRGRKGRGYAREMGVHEKVSPKCSLFGIMGHPLGATPVPCTFRKLTSSS